MKNLIKTFILMTILTSSVISAKAQKTVAMQFSELPADAASASTADICFHNEELLKGNQFCASLTGILYSQSYDPSTYMNFKTEYCLKGKSSLSLYGNFGMGKEYDIYNSGGFQDGSYRPKQFIIGVGGGYRILDFLIAHGRLKLMSDNPARDISYNALGADISITGQFHVNKNGEIIAEAGLYSIGSKIKSAVGRDFPLPTSVEIKAGYILDFCKNNTLRFLGEADYYFNNVISAAIAVDALIANLLSFRAGYNTGALNILSSYASVGAGVNLFGVHIDVAYLIGGKDSPMSNTLCLSAGWAF